MRMTTTTTVAGAVLALALGSSLVAFAAGAGCDGKTAGSGCCAKKASQQASTGCAKGDHGQAKQADNSPAEGSCPLTAAKQAYEQARAAGGCEKTAREAYRNAMAETAYAKSLTESGCAESASRAAYETVLKETGCAATADAAYRHVVGKTAYDSTLEATGCTKSAQEAYDKAAHDAPEVKLATAEPAPAAATEAAATAS
jgi:hypothetical protein